MPVHRSTHRRTGTFDRETKCVRDFSNGGLPRTSTHNRLDPQAGKDGVEVGRVMRANTGARVVVV